VGQWDFLNKSLRLSGFMNKNDSLYKKNKKFVGKKMLELGCQGIRYEVCKKILSKGRIRGQMKKKMLTGISGMKKGISAKKYFKFIGFDHISMDISGGRGSLKIDLSKSINNIFYNTFDIVTNSGTSEHVFPLDGQYECFKNIHLCTKKNGVMVHLIPFSGFELKGHCPILYNNNFFESLAKLNNYKLVLSEEISVKTIKLRYKSRKKDSWMWGSKMRKFTLMGFCLIKLKNNDFSKNKEEILKHIEVIDM